MSVDEKYLFTTTEDSVKEKDWAAGSSKRSDNTEYVIGRGLCTISYPPALWKIFDETLVNATDHLVRMLGSDTPVTEIRVTYKDGVIGVWNNGPGVEVAIHNAASKHFGVDTYVPTFIFGTLFQGSNRKKSDDCIIGGTNGVGAKIANCMSTVFEVETVDSQRGLKFTQKWRDGMKIAEKPSIVQYKKSPYTSIKFTPDYMHFGYTTTPDSLPSAECLKDLNDVFRTRTYFAAAYAHYTVGGRSSKSKVKVSFNGEVLSAYNTSDLAELLFPGADKISTIVTTGGKSGGKSGGKTTGSQYSWEVTVVFCKSPLRELSNVNGVVVRGGKHTKWILDKISAELKTKLSSQFNNMKFNSNVVSSHVFLVCNCKIPNPSWEGQRKDTLEYDTKKFNDYVLDKKFLKSIVTKFQEVISSEVFQKLPSATGRKKNVVISDKYHTAKYAGTKKSNQCILMPVEGDSAMQLLENAITLTHGFDYIGVISTQGVIMNARTKSSVTQVSGSQYVNKNQQLEENKFFSTFCEVTGLSTSYKYDPDSPTYAKEMRELRYGRICAAVDQDLDGKGNILGSLLSVFEYWWPNLLKAGFLCWFCTPIIRAYPPKKGVVLQFYSEPEYKKWVETGELSGSNASKQSTAGKIPLSQYSIRYYKGLGTHERSEAISMMRELYKSMITYTVDSDASKYFNIYFGNDPNLRKIELSQPTIPPSDEAVLRQYKEKTLTCTEHLRWDTNMYQKDNIQRKLDHIIDGQNQAGRKILDGIITAFKGSNKEKKVAVLAGYISETKNYHHGEASLCSSIIGKGFIGTGGKQLPFIVPCSNFGSRAAGGTDASQPRYVFGKLNKQLVHKLFPKVDYPLLEFYFDEGKRGEPTYFVPIIPLAICESTDIPAHGWKITTWARDVLHVINNVRSLINGGSLMPMQPCTYAGTPYAWKGTFNYIRGKLYSFGDYHVISDSSGDTVYITELPLREWTTTYMASLAKKNDGYIEQVTNNSSDSHIDIQIKLAPGALAVIETLGDHPFTDGIEEYFKLRSRMVDHINLIDVDNGVKSLSRYEEVFDTWFPIRKKFYAERVKRQIELISLRIIYYENLIRYIRDDTMRLSKRTIKEMERLLEESKYIKINKNVIEKPGFLKTTELRDAVLGESADYRYILGLTEYKKSSESLIEYESELQKLRNELNDFQSSRDIFPGASQWLKELSELQEIFIEGSKTRWQFEEFNAYTF